VRTPDYNSGRTSAVLVAAFIALSVQPAAAQGFFESLFGWGPRYIRQHALPPQASSYSDPFSEPDREARPGYGGGGQAFCVRTCDGRYFPLQRHSGASPAEMCHSFCPAAKTAVFSGSSIDYAVASNGTRYADLENAFVYRDRVVDNCTCNGKDVLGLAHISATTDPTLRPGDIVATNEGLVNFRGRSNRAAAFTPINPSSSAWAQKLSEVKVRPAPPEQPVVAAPVVNKDADKSARKESRRAQRRATTLSARDSEDVSPGDSIPNR
jgi:hypothetical protein